MVQSSTATSISEAIRGINRQWCSGCRLLSYSSQTQTKHPYFAVLTLAHRDVRTVEDLLAVRVAFCKLVSLNARDPKWLKSYFLRAPAFQTPPNFVLLPQASGSHSLQLSNHFKESFCQRLNRPALLRGRRYDCARRSPDSLQRSRS